MAQGHHLLRWLRRSHTDFLTTNSINSIAYDTVNPSPSSPDVSATYHLRSLPTQTQVFDAGNNEKSRATFEYDNYVATPSSRSVWCIEPVLAVSTLLPQSVTRLAAMLPAPRDGFFPPGTQLHSYPQYDIAGNVVKTTDPLGNATDFYFEDRFGSPNGEAQSNTPPAELGGNGSFAFVTKVRNAANHYTYTQYDYYLGRAVDGEDANGVVSSGYFEDFGQPDEGDSRRQPCRRKSDAVSLRRHR